MADAKKKPGNKRARRLAGAKQRSANASNEFERALIAGQEGERRRLAREIHDGLNQMLSVLAIDVARLAGHENLSSDVRERLLGVERRVLNIIDEARRMSHQLHPTIVENLGLAASLEGLCADFSRSSPFAVRCEHSALPDRIPLDLSVALYRVAQEALRNVAKHAAATAVTLSLVGSPGRITLTVADNGRGLSREQLARKTGLGFDSMTERLRTHRGSLTIAGRPGKGVRVTAKVPLPSSPQSRKS